MDNCSIICLIACIVIAIVVVILLLSMDSLEPLEVGITYNKVTKNIGDSTYGSGRYLIGPFKSFISYPENLVTVEFSNNRKAVGDALQSRTNDGLALSLHVSFQYRINRYFLFF